MRSSSVSLSNALAISHIRDDPLGRDAAPPHAKRREAYCLTSDKMTNFGVYRREQLRPGHVVEGPAIVDEGVTRTVIHTGQSLTVDELGNLVIKA